MKTTNTGFEREETGLKGYEDLSITYRAHQLGGGSKTIHKIDVGPTE